MSNTSRVSEAIARAIAGITGPARLRALKLVQWYYVATKARYETGPAHYIGVSELGEAFISDEQKDAQIYDGRDNEESRAAFFTALFKRPVHACLCES